MEERARSREQEPITLSTQNVDRIPNEQNRELIGGPREFQKTVTLEQQDVSLIPNQQNQEPIGGSREFQDPINLNSSQVGAIYEAQDTPTLKKGLTVDDYKYWFQGQEDLPSNPNQV